MLCDVEEALNLIPYAACLGIQGFMHVVQKHRCCYDVLTCSMESVDKAFRFPFLDDLSKDVSSSSSSSITARGRLILLESLL